MIDMNKAQITLFITLIMLVVLGITIYNDIRPKRTSLKTETPTQETTQLSNVKINEMEESTMQNNQDTKQYSSAPEMQIDQNKIYVVTMTTDQGEITLELDPKSTPITVNNFVTLAKDGFYNNTIFHRVIDGFMIQGGDPQGTGMGGPGYKFSDEEFEGEYVRGTIAMANSGPNTNGSQFFIMHQDNGLPKNYVIFGKVISGMETVDKIATAQVKTSMSGENSSPVVPVKIQTMLIEEK